MFSDHHLNLRLLRLKSGIDWSHKREALSLFIVQDGTGKCAWGASVENLARGDIFVLNGATDVKVSPCPGAELLLAGFTVCLEHLYPLFGITEISRLETICHRFSTPRLYRAAGPVASKCQKLLADLPEEFTLDHRSQLLRIAAAVLNDEFKNLPAAHEGLARTEVHLAKVFEKLTREELFTLSVSELAQKFGCSRRHLNRIFHQFLGISVATLRMEMRLLKAASLLRDPDLKVIHVAEQSGFNHLGLFNTCFKRRFGFSPGEWRKRFASTGPTSAPPAKSDPECRLLKMGLCPWANGVSEHGSPAHKSEFSCLSPSPAHAERPVHKIASRMLTAALVLFTSVATAQETSRPSIAGNTAAEASRLEQQNLPYTFKTGDFRLLVTPSIGIEYNDNINVSHDDAEDDFILKPMLRLNASYPITQANLLQFDIGVGYDYYFDHNDWSGLRLRSGSALSYDIFVKDFRINIHDRFEYTGDSAGRPDIANNAQYEFFQNTAGLTTTWDLKDLVLTAGYDHLNYISQSDQFDYRDHASEIVSSRAGLKLHPTLTAGVEGNVSFTRYDQAVLNDYTGYNGGAYAEWNPSSFVSVQPRIGYSYYDFDQTSVFILAENQDAWYIDLTVRHDITEAISYSLSAGHELRPGVETDMVDAWYARPSITWDIIRNVSLTTSLSYEHGQQSDQGLGGARDETYDWFGGSVHVAYYFRKNLRAALNYRFTLRSSDIAVREYTQNLVGLELTYLPR